ncbi:MAG: hypothetical protein LBC69_03425 [Eubacteriaceae bacterium]|nr:hypothetical protein [Eubacteriaceae bacterium]
MFKAAILLAALVSLAMGRGVGEAVILGASYAVHEAFHLIAASLLSVKVRGADAGGFGFAMRFARSDLKAGIGAVVFLAGPFGNIAFALSVYIASLMEYMPSASFFVFYNIALAAANLLPAYPLDCARAIESIARLWLTPYGSVRLVASISHMTSCVLFATGLYLFVYKTDSFLLMALAVFLFASTARETSSARMETLRTLAQGEAAQL